MRTPNQLRTLLHLRGNGPLVFVIALKIPPIVGLPAAVPSSPLAALLRWWTRDEHLKVQAHGVAFVSCVCMAACFRAAQNYMILAHLFGAGCLYSCTYRAKLRGLYSLPPEPCEDCCVHHFCFCYALCQEYHELKNRGHYKQCVFKLCLQKRS
ncbi:hypothetical protein SO802_014071 [Lithocarpus litseifolius]|uniref:Uncharacterized protein n=1 Tax=Lithocarpus litseifolius TaxID=425828 RepID=A0AAW2D7D3_9ROSI